MDDDDSLHRLEGISEQKGGLILKKKPPTFKVPQPSLLGLDKLAAAKRKEREEAARKISFDIDNDEPRGEDGGSVRGSRESRRFRVPNEETPTYTGGITEEARLRQLDRLSSNRRKEKGVYASSKDLKPIREDDRYKSIKHDRRYKDDRKYGRERNRGRERSEHGSTQHGDRTPRFKDEPQTPNTKVSNMFKTW